MFVSGFPILVYIHIFEKPKTKSGMDFFIKLLIVLIAAKPIMSNWT